MKDSDFPIRTQSIEEEATVEHLNAVIAFIETTLSTWHVKPEFMERFAIPVGEAVMNVMSYAYPSAPGRVLVSLTKKGSRLRADIQDNGLEFDPTAWPTPDTSLPLEQRPVGGLGIHIMRNMLSILKYQREHSVNHLVMEMEIDEDDASKIQSSAPPVEVKEKVLIADDYEPIRASLRTMLSIWGYAPIEAANGEEALKILQGPDAPSLAILDCKMPVMDGPSVCRKLRSQASGSYTYLMLLTAFGGHQNLVEGLNAGADEFLTKPIIPDELRSRLATATRIIRYERMMSQQKKDLDLANTRLQEWKNRLAKELAEAANYVHYLLPPFMDGDVQASWRFISQTSLGGDFFGYRWLDPDHLGFYVLDACGHGLGAAMYCISVNNVLGSQILPQARVPDPAQVLTKLNEIFRMDKHNNMYFTIWFGIYNRTERRLVYASGGHPPALFTRPKPDGEGFEARYLGTDGIAIGCLPTAMYANAVVDIPAGSKLFIYSDGVLDNRRTDGQYWTRETLANFLLSRADEKDSDVDRVARQIQQDNMEDDFCLLGLFFP